MGKNRGQRNFLCPAFFVPANDTCIACRRAVGSSACKSCRNPSQIETEYFVRFMPIANLRIFIYDKGEDLIGVVLHEVGQHENYEFTHTSSECNTETVS